MKFEWNTLYLGKKAETMTTCDKQPYKFQYRSEINQIYEDIEDYSKKQDVGPGFDGETIEAALAKDPVLQENDALINACFRAKFLKFTSQILKWNDFASKKKSKPKPKSVLKA